MHQSIVERGENHFQVWEGVRPAEVALWIEVNEPRVNFMYLILPAQRRQGKNEDVEWKTGAARKKEIELGCIFLQLSIAPSVN